VISSLRASPLKPCTHFSPLPCVHLILLVLICLMIFGVETKLRNSTLCNFHHSPVSPNILFRALLSNSLSLCSFLNVTDQVSHPCKTAGRGAIMLPKFMYFVLSMLGIIQFIYFITCSNYYGMRPFAFHKIRKKIIQSHIKFKACSNLYSQSLSSMHLTCV
jgi:hypothetical protein